MANTAKPIILAPLSVKEAVSALLKVPPPPKKSKAKKK
jgi:hypothetical protein